MKTFVIETRGRDACDTDRGARDQTIHDVCEGVVPLRARLEPWMESVCHHEPLSQWIQQHGSPLNILCSDPLQRNIQDLDRVASDRNIDFRVFFARKANKCLCFVNAAREAGAGIDTASENELRQVVADGLDPRAAVCTAAIKDISLLRFCVESRVTVAIDNVDELSRITRIATDLGTKCTIAMRISGFQHQGRKLDSRFGIDVDDVVDVVRRYCHDEASSVVAVAGVHFHLDGYDASERVSAIQQSLDFVDSLGRLGHRPAFLDIGGGFPMSYVESETQWQTFVREHRRALLGHREPITRDNDGLGLIAVDGEIHGRLNCYPSFQCPVQNDWLATILDARCDRESVAEAIRRRGLQLRCEPGRSLLDGCGMTVARVEYRKQHRCGDWLIGLSMNSTQCKTMHDDFLVDPIVVRANSNDETEEAGSAPVEGYLVGAYCMESEYLLKRKLRFPRGIQLGDLVVFPNTAGYLMHFLESRSHQFPLARNLVVNGNGAGAMLDQVDRLAIQRQAD